jgi:hypothetical protein
MGNEESAEIRSGESTSSVEITRGQKGAVGYNVKIYDKDADKAYAKAVEIEKKLRTEYGGAP